MEKFFIRDDVYDDSRSLREKLLHYSDVQIKLSRKNVFDLMVHYLVCAEYNLDVESAINQSTLENYIFHQKKDDSLATISAWDLRRSLLFCEDILKRNHLTDAQDQFVSLEIGVGKGLFSLCAYILAKRSQCKDIRIFGFDNDEEAVETSKNILQDQLHIASIWCADAKGIIAYSPLLQKHLQPDLIICENIPDSHTPIFNESLLDIRSTVQNVFPKNSAQYCPHKILLKDAKDSSHCSSFSWKNSQTNAENLTAFSVSLNTFSISKNYFHPLYSLGYFEISECMYPSAFASLPQRWGKVSIGEGIKIAPNIGDGKTYTLS